MDNIEIENDAKMMQMIQDLTAVCSLKSVEIF